ncbi:MAG TPA: hypothetical protein DCX53_06415 [Anaerolineae bacterium]|nr:hypothetical protein [Anaerolineae bacterium]
MLITKNYRTDQEVILRFVDALGAGLALLSGNKKARPGFFVFAHTFIQEFVEESLFKKEELLIKALEENGFPIDDGPIGSLRAEQTKSREAAEHMLSAAKGWLAGDEQARGEVAWAASEYTSTMRAHLERLKSRIFPLLEQNISPEDEHKISEGLNTLAFENSAKGDEEKYVKLVESLEEELSGWK